MSVARAKRRGRAHKNGGRKLRFRPPCRLMKVGLIRDFNNAADFDAARLGKRVRADGHAGGDAGISVEVLEKLARAVDDLRVLVEFGRRLHVAQDLHEVLHAVEIAKFLLENGEEVEARELRGLVAVFERNVAAERAAVLRHAVDVGRLAGEVDEVADALRGHVETRRSAHFGELEAHLGELGFDLHD